jgi:hypothetical protein
VNIHTSGQSIRGDPHIWTLKVLCRKGKMDSSVVLHNPTQDLGPVWRSDEQVEFRDRLLSLSSELYAFSCITEEPPQKSPK